MAIDVIVGRGALMRDALARASIDPVLVIPVITALDLVLLKLEAGGPQDLADIVSLLEVQRRLRGHDQLRADTGALLPTLSPWARKAWRRLEAISSARP